MIQSQGIGSGLDVANLVQQLVQAERQPVANRLNLQQSRAQAELSALGQYRGALTSFQIAVADLGADDGPFSAVSAKSGNEDRYTASAAGGSAAGRYDVEVLQLAQAHRLASGAFADTATNVGHGTLTIGVGAAGFDVDIASDAATLADIRDAINNADNNPGVTASVISADDGARLILSADQSGADSALTVTAAGGDGGLAALVYDPGTLESLSQLDAAQDAQIRVDGFLASSATNRFEDVIQDVTITAVDAAPGETDPLTVSRDDQAIIAAVQKFVDGFNNVTTTVNRLTGVDSEGKGSILTGDSLLRNAGNQFRRLLSDEFGGQSGLNTLAELGIEFDDKGKLQLDQAALQSALDTDFKQVVNVFAGDSGVVKALDSALDGLIDSDGLIQGREDGLESRLDRIGDQREALERRISRIEARYEAQFAALDSLISQLRNTSDFLSSQLANLPGPRRPDRGS